MKLFNYLSEQLSFELKSSSSLSGGDISDTHKLSTSLGDLVIKRNDANLNLMLKREAEGLQLLRENTDFIRIPEVLLQGTFEQDSFLVIEYIQPGNPKQDSHINFGKALAQLHSNTQEKWGMEGTNYIGSLPQENRLHNTWEELYWQERISPQLKRALYNGYLKQEDIPKGTNAVQLFKEVFSPHAPALLHGDLWNGNYFFDTEGKPVLIDPSVYYGHPMMDIGMAHLFGGFSSDFFESYYSENPITGNKTTQIELAQLYYLLVHLNLFGTSYLGSVKNILEKYF